MRLGRRKKIDESPEIKIANEKIIGLILESDMPLDMVGKKNGLSQEDIIRLFDDYHNSLDLKLEQDKQKREDVKILQQEIEVGLKSLRESQPKLTSRNGPPKNYCQANIGGKWVEYSPLKRMGGFSTVKVVGKII